MALTLRTAITADQTTFDVLGGDDLQPGDLKTLDSETIVIRTAKASTLAYLESARYRVSVYRGSGGTRAAAHAANATLSTYSAGGGGGGVTVTGTQGGGPFTATALDLPGIATDLGGGSVGIALVSTLIGPFPIAWDTPGIVDDGSGTTGAALAEVPTGALVLKTFALGSDPAIFFDQAGLLKLGLGHADGSSLSSLVSYSILNQFDVGMTSKEPPPSDLGSTAVVGVSGQVATDVLRTWLVAVIELDGASPTQGTADVYAIIATQA